MVEQTALNVKYVISVMNESKNFPGCIKLWINIHIISPWAVGFVINITKGELEALCFCSRNKTPYNLIANRRINNCNMKFVISSKRELCGSLSSVTFREFPRTNGIVCICMNRLHIKCTCGKVGAFYCVRLWVVLIVGSQ